MSSDTPTDGRCNAQTRDGGYCDNHPVEGKERCRMHGAFAGVSDPEKLEGNQNAMKTGLHSDPVNLLEWLLEEDREAAVWILNKLHDYAERAPVPVYKADIDAYQVDDYEDVRVNLTGYGDDVLHMCIRDYARWRATKEQLQGGIIKEQMTATDDGPVPVEDSNPVNLDLDRMDKTTIRQKDKLGLLPSPESKQAEVGETLCELLSEE